MANTYARFFYIFSIYNKNKKYEKNCKKKHTIFLRKNDEGASLNHFLQINKFVILIHNKEAKQ